MAQVSHLYRRPSGIYAVRLAVPLRHRAAIGKGELHLTTGTRTLAVAKTVASAMLLHWRERFLSLERLQRMDIERLVTGSPKLVGSGFLRLTEAVETAGLSEEDVLREAAEGRVRLYSRVAGVSGHLVPLDALDANPETVGAYDVPKPAQMPVSAVQVSHAGLVKVRHGNATSTLLLEQRAVNVVLFDLPERPGWAFAPENPVCVTRSNIEVLASEIEALRVLLAAKVTPEQLTAAKAVNNKPGPIGKTGKSGKRFSEAVAAYMVDKEKRCASDHARRVRAACNLFGELQDDPRLDEIDRDRLRDFIAETLPKVPARENLLRIKLGTASVRASMAVAPEDWPGLSIEEQQFRVMCLVGLFQWLRAEGWIALDPATGLTKVVRGGTAAPKKRAQDARDPFSDDELVTIFSQPWWKEGKGTLTFAGTYREFSPFYYWLPLLGLFTGARINELCQLAVTDIRVTEAGVWFIDVNEDGDSKSLKNANSRRLIPVHPTLIQLGLIDWRDRLEAEGFDRLFPELSHHDIKGYSKDAVKWFSRFLAGLGFPRDNRRTFHSFRHGFSSQCANKLQVSEAVLSQLTGHKRGDSTLMTVYRKDVVPDVLVETIKAVSFNLPPVASFDLDAGVKAIRDATRRKRSK